MRRSVFGALLCLALAVPASAQDVRVRLAIDSSSCRIGEWLPATLTVTAPPNVKLTLPSAAGGFEHAEIVAGEPEKTREQNGAAVREKHYVLTVFDTGSVSVSASVRYRTPGDTATYTAVSNSVALRVAGVQLDTAKTFRDIKDVLDVPLTIWDYLLYAGIVIAIAAAAWFGYRWWKRRPVEAPVAPPPPPRPADEIAFEKLRVLENGHVWQEGRHKEYQSDLSEIVREYIEHGFGIPALEQTTGEILDGVRRFGWDGDLLEDCGRILTISDRTKFAKYIPTPQEHVSGLKAAYGFVERTRPRQAAQETPHAEEQPAESPHG